MSEDLDIRKLVEASRAAAKPDCVSEDVANKALEAICAAGAAAANVFDLWPAINEQIGKAQAPGLKEQLIDLRTRFEEKLLVTEISRIERAFSQGPDAGWQAWLTTLAQAIVLYRLRFSESLCSHSFPFSESHRQLLEDLRKAICWMFQNQWAEAYKQIDCLTNVDFLPVETRARLCVIAGQVQLFYFVEPDRAREGFDTAERLAPDDPKVLSGAGNYWAEKRDFNKASYYYNRAIKVAPAVAGGYTGMGAYFETEGDLETARKWYLEAIEAAPGESLGYEKLFKLYGHPTLFKEHEGELHSLMQRARMLSPEDEYQLYLDLGFCYEQNERFGEAQIWYEKATSLDPETATGYLTIARGYEKQRQKDKAEEAYKKAIEVAPECYDGYWGLTNLYEEQERWKEALEWFQRAPLHIEDWAAIMQAKIGEMYWRLQNYSQAEDTLTRVLSADKNNETARRVLQTIAVDYYQNLKDKESATRINRDLLGVLGDSYLGDYHNWLGNMSYFYDEYTEAANEYLAAIAAEPQSPIFHRNLSEAYKQLNEWSAARRSLDDAYAIDNDINTKNQEMALLVNAEGNDYYAKDDYTRAIDLYTEAIKLDANNDVIYSNLGGAWEQLREKGKRLEALDKSIEAYESANRIKATEGYERDIARLQRKRKYASRYGVKAIDWLHMVTPIAVEVSKDLIPLVEGSAGSSLAEDLSRRLAEMKKRVQDEYCVRTPIVRFRGNETDLRPQTYFIEINEIPLVMATVELNQRFVPGSAETLTTIGAEGKEAYNPLNGEKGSWLPRDYWEKAESAGLELWDVVEYLVRHLESVIRHNLVEFLGHQEVADIVQLESPESLPDLRTSPGKLAALVAVCRSLVAEEVPIQPFLKVFKTFDTLYSPSASLQQVVESIRSLPALRPRLPGNDPQYGIVSVGPRFEADIRNSIYQNGAGSVLAMDPESCQSALSAARGKVETNRNVAVVVEDDQLRPYVRLLLELEYPNNPVLSRRELRTDADFKTMGLIELEEQSTPSKPDFSNRKSIEISNNDRQDGHGIELESEIGITVFVNQRALGNEAGADDQPTEEIFSLMQDGLFYELGIVLPEVRVEVDHNLKANEFWFNLNGLKSEPLQGLKPDEFLVNDVTERLRLLNIESRQALNPANGNECAIVTEAQASVEICHEAGLTTWGPAGFLVLALSAEIRKNASTFQTLETTSYILESLRVEFPELIAATLNRFSVEQICLVLKDLLDDQISIRDLRSILESMLSISGTTDVDLSRYIIFTPQAQSLCPVSGNRDIDHLRISDYSDFVRASLKRYISHKYTRGSNTLTVYLLDPAIEKRLSDINTRPLTNEEITSIKAAVSFEVGSLPKTNQNPVLLTTMDVRRTMRKLIDPDHPDLPVLSFQELSPDMNIQPIARISLA